MKLFRFKKPAGEAPPAVGEVVIIDDTPENLHLLNEILSDRNYKVRALPNGQMGLSACKASPPDLVLLDITMPGMDGYEVAEKLKADPDTKEIPIIFISAMSQTEDKVRAFRAGGVDYVTKPLQVEEVMARVETHLSISRMREQLDQANQKLLAWAVEISQPGVGSAGASDSAIPDGLAACFGKPAALLQEGDRAEASLSIVALSSPSDELLAQIAAGLADDHGAAAIARFGGILVAISASGNEALAVWLEGSSGSEDLSASLGEGGGVLQVVKTKGALDLDFKCPAVLETVAALAGMS